MVYNIYTGNKYSINLWNKYDVESFSPGSMQIGVPSINNNTNMIMIRLNVNEIPYKGDYVLKTTSAKEFDWYGVHVMAIKNVLQSNIDNENIELNEDGNYNMVFLFKFKLINFCFKLNI